MKEVIYTSLMIGIPFIIVFSFELESYFYKIRLFNLLNTILYYLFVTIGSIYTMYYYYEDIGIQNYSLVATRQFTSTEKGRIYQTCKLPLFKISVDSIKDFGFISAYWIYCYCLPSYMIKVPVKRIKRNMNYIVLSLSYILSLAYMVVISPILVCAENEREHILLEFFNNNMNIKTWVFTLILVLRIISILYFAIIFLKFIKVVVMQKLLKKNWADS
jgi:uncharacterized membrane protein YcfT